jgi:peptidoglycan/xylan/chitin deacetylase (PgdA/CDA1 family)
MTMATPGLTQDEVDATGFTRTGLTTADRSEVMPNKVAITFDDGPHESNTPRLLALLDRLRIKATFFVLGKMVKANRAILKRIAMRQHEIGNHTWSHKLFNCISDDEIRKELTDAEAIISEVVGTPPTLMRPPGGYISRHQMHWIAKEFSYHIVGFDVDPLDYQVKPRPKTPEEIKAFITTHTKQGNTVLAHDIHERTVEAMLSTLPFLQARFKLVTVSQSGKFTKNHLDPSPCPRSRS